MLQNLQFFLIIPNRHKPTLPQTAPQTETLKKGPGSVLYQEEFNKDFIGRELVGDFSWSSNVDCAHIVHNPLAVVW